MVEKVMVAVDGSPAADVAFEVALEQAKKFGAELTVVAIVEPSHLFPKSFAVHAPSVKEVDKKYRHLVAAYVMRAETEAVKVTGLVGTSKKPGRAIVAATKDSNIDVLVVGRTGLGALQRVRRTLMGSCSDYCVTHATCTVIVARGFTSDEIHVPVKYAHRMEELARKERTPDGPEEEHEDKQKVIEAEEEERQRRIKEGGPEREIPLIYETRAAVIAAEELERQRRLKVQKLATHEGEWKKQMDLNIVHLLEEQERQSRIDEDARELEKEEEARLRTLMEVLKLEDQARSERMDLLAQQFGFIVEVEKDAPAEKK